MDDVLWVLLELEDHVNDLLGGAVPLLGLGALRFQENQDQELDQVVGPVDVPVVALLHDQGDLLHDDPIDVLQLQEAREDPLY